MELYSAEVESIKKLTNEWIQHDEHELECTFGKGTVDSTTFFQIAQRLRSKGLRELSQEDRLTITTPEHVRFTLQSMGIIQQYCRDDVLNGKPFIAMIKDRTLGESNIDLDDYEVRIKTRREIPMSRDEAQIQELLARWPVQKKAFRMIRRWSFEEKGLRYDLSIVRSTQRDLKGEFKWQRKFTDQDLSVAPYLYEVEVELIRLDGDTIEDAQKRLIKGIGEVLRGIQKNSILMRKTKKEKILNSYQNITNTNRFLGCSPVTLEQKNFIDDLDDATPNLRKGYNVTDKADGLRVLGLCDSKGDLYLIDITMNIYKTGLNNINLKDSIVDGEWVTRTDKKEPINQLLLFDIYYNTDKTNVSQLPFYSKEVETNTRYKHMTEWVERFNKGDGPKKTVSYLNSQTTLQVSNKKFLFAKSNDLSIFKQAAKVLDTYRIYHTDGLIFTPNELPLPGYDDEKKTIQPSATFFSQFKWKPSEDNTIDFLVRFEKLPENEKVDRINTGIKPETNESIRYKTMRLYVGSSRNKAFNPRDMLLNERKFDDSYGKYRPIPFYPKQFSDSMASVSYNEVRFDPATQEEYVATELNNEPIQDKSIVEMRYDPSLPRGWRWIPLRIRHDKTERLHRGILARTLNSEDTADSVWNSINDPITQTMIRSGSSTATHKEVSETLTKAEERNNITMKYFNRPNVTDDVLFVRGLREFHNHYIKEVVLYSTVLKGGNKKLVDIACGTGSDIRRWSNARVRFVLGIDYAGDNITNIENGAYAQYTNHIQKSRNREVAPMIFVIGDSSKRIIDGQAGSTDEERDILRSVFGEYPPMGPIPPYIDHKGAGELKGGTDAMSCMFALHYFFENKEKLDKLLKNIRECIKLGGYFFGCCFDGESVFKFLRDTPSGGTMTGIEKDSVLWNIRKDYSEDELPSSEDSLGMKINVGFISIGKPHDEYLVNFNYFTTRMNENGFELLNANELKEIGLQNSTNLFSNSYEMSTKSGKNYIMSDAVKQFSFLNRWFVFRKKQDVVVQEKDDEEFVPLQKKKTLSVGFAPMSKDINVVDEGDEEESVTPTTLNKIPNAIKTVQIAEETKPVDKTVQIAEETKPIDTNIQVPVNIERTIPVEKVIGIPKGKTYALNEVFNFYIDAALDDKKLRIGDKGAARYLSPQTPFRIEDPDDKSIVYPSIEHFLAGMMYKYGTDKPQLAQSIFSREGTIHQSFLRRRLIEYESKQKPIPDDKDHDFIKEESEEIKLAIRPAAFRKNKAIFNEAKFVTKKDELLQYAVEQRYKKDERLRKIIEAARKANKYLLYYTHGASGVNMGGKRKADGTIEGDNKLGNLYMKLGGYIVE